TIRGPVIERDRRSFAAGGRDLSPECGRIRLEVDRGHIGYRREGNRRGRQSADGVNSGDVRRGRFAKSEAGQRLVARSKGGGQIDRGLIKTRIAVGTAVRAAAADVDAVHSLQGKTRIEKPVWRIVIGDERSAVIEMEGQRADARRGSGTGVGQDGN